jgi:hypothetical protein
MNERKSLISRIGTFFLLVGTGFMILFIASDLGAGTQFGYFFLGLAGLAAGFFLKRITAPPPAPGRRFGGVKTYLQKRREARQKRAEARKAKQQQKK